MFIHDRIKEKLKEHGLKQADLARATGKSSVAVTKWMRGENTPKADALKAIASLLKVSDEWLLNGKETKKDKKVENNNINFSDKTVRKIPILDMVQAGNWREVVYDGINGIGDVYTTYQGTIPGDIFSVKVAGESMIPRFQPLDELVIDPNISVSSGDFVIATNNDYEVTFKKYRVTGYDEYGREEFELIALNPDFAPLSSKVHKIRIIGVVVEHINRLK
ncbi:LexA family protein [Acinetobacter pollinis]|uniref:Helix-turn-helix domain-containing protein n=1 Tax=Acinetobacter pollinis TaxID=2605270 RepID=A0ABU6DWN3_9GAMM|nr:S24 family peptidase [Acinetobacter pollinis]MEB5477288.1 helix-turn-helix domain-containing protein [Acinetobacter pollinis]